MVCTEGEWVGYKRKCNEKMYGYDQITKLCLIDVLQKKLFFDRHTEIIYIIKKRRIRLSI